LTLSNELTENGLAGSKTRRLGVQERLERSWLGRLAISGFLIFTILAMVVSNLPRSEDETYAKNFFDPYLTATDLRQRWNLFAPDPSKKTLQLSARISYADGSSEIWNFPARGNFLDPYRYYRWRKLARRVNSNTSIAILWQPVALWIGREQADPDRRPVAVALIRRWATTPAPGTDEKVVWQEKNFVTVPIPPTSSR
jgi:hypothetical protein